MFPRLGEAKGELSLHRLQRLNERLIAEVSGPSLPVSKKALRLRELAYLEVLLLLVGVRPAEGNTHDIHYRGAVAGMICLAAYPARSEPVRPSQEPFTFLRLNPS